MMYHLKKTPLWIGLLAVIAVTTGCSGEPSSGDIEKAVKAGFERANPQMRNFGGGLGTIEVHGVKKIGCAAATGSSGFNCDVELDMSVPFVGRSKGVKQIRFVKASNGWQAVDANK